MSAPGMDRQATRLLTTEERRAAEREDLVRLVLLVAVVAALAFALARALQDQGSHPGLGAAVAAGVLAWPPRGEGLAGTPAFSPAVCPVLTTCCWCGAEIGHGPEATRLHVELRVCSRCPAEESVRAAMLAGVAVGLRSSESVPPEEEEARTREVMCFPPYEFGSAEWNAWKRGWWAGHFAGDEDERALVARFQLDVSTGVLRPSAGGAS